MLQSFISGFLSSITPSPVYGQRLRFLHCHWLDHRYLTLRHLRGHTLLEDFPFHRKVALPLHSRPSILLNNRLSDIYLVKDDNLLLCQLTPYHNLNSLHPAPEQGCLNFHFDQLQLSEPLDQHQLRSSLLLVDQSSSS